MRPVSSVRTSALRRSISSSRESTFGASETSPFTKESKSCGGNFPLAADAGAKIAKQYDSLLVAKPGWSNRTSYVISPAGTIAHVHSDLSPKQHVQETLDAVTALKK